MADTYFYDEPNNRYINEATGAVDPNPSGQAISQARPDANLPGYSYIPGTSANSDPAALQAQYGAAPVKDAAGLYQLPDSVLNKFGGFDGSLAAFLAPLAIGGAGAIGALGGFGGAAAGGLGAEGFAAAPAAISAAGGAGLGLTAEELAAIGGAFPATSGIGATGLLGMAPEELAAIGGAFPATSGAAGAGAGFQPGYNFLDPSTYSATGGAGNTPLDAAPGAGTVGSSNFIPAINQMGALAPNMASSFGINSGLGLSAGETGAISGAFPLSSGAEIGGANIATGGAGFTGATDLVTNAATSTAEEVLKKIKDSGGSAMDWIAKNPASAAMLGLSAANALSKPKLPEAAQTVQKANTPNLESASGVVNSGGSTGSAWNTQKAAIDSAIDRQIAEKKQQILQQAQNSGMGVDSLVTVQQIQKMQEQMEGLRQQQYMQAQQQNVQAALTEMGMSNQALGQVAGQQFASSKQAQTSAAQTAQLALMLQQLQKPTANQGAAANPT